MTFNWCGNNLLKLDCCNDTHYTSVKLIAISLWHLNAVRACIKQCIKYMEMDETTKFTTHMCHDSWTIVLSNITFQH
jgi:hypothetical protein